MVSLPCYRKPTASNKKNNQQSSRWQRHTTQSRPPFHSTGMTRTTSPISSWHSAGQPRLASTWRVPSSSSPTPKAGPLQWSNWGHFHTRILWKKGKDFIIQGSAAALPWILIAHPKHFLRLNGCRLHHHRDRGRCGCPHLLPRRCRTFRPVINVREKYSPFSVYLFHFLSIYSWTS